MEYERLTVKRHDKNYIKTPVDGVHDFLVITNRVGKYEYTTGEVIDRLAELEDKIEQGTLVELPCKVGDTLYFLQYYCDSRGCSKDTQSYCCGCKEMITRERYNEKYIIATKNCKWSDIPSIGENHFVTRAEAEEKLKELQEKQK